MKLILNNELIESNINELPHKNCLISHVFVVKWRREISLCQRVQKEDSWILATNQPADSSAKIGHIYEGRFSIEKMFKNKKSGGFDLEKLRIEKYDRFKR